MDDALLRSKVDEWKRKRIWALMSIESQVKADEFDGWING